ncbi:MAG: PAS domain-containing protein [Balneolaceae bacterium]|nr:PAS domain-containing protein [Balneolaceae bacterium]
MITARGNEKWIRAVGETEFRNGRCTRIYGSTQDITQRKETERKLREVVEHSTNMFYRHDTDHVLTYVSPQSEDFLGCPPEEAKKRWTEFVTDHPINEKGLRHTQKAIKTGEAQPSFPLELKKTTGETIWVQVNEAPITENGKTVAMRGSLSDITAQKRYEEQLQESLKRYEYVTRATSDVVWDWNLLDDTIFWGEGIEHLFGYDLDTMPEDSSSWTEHIHPDDKQWVYESIMETIEGGEQNWFEEYRYIKADGSYAFVEDRGFVIRDKDGNAVRMIGAMRDVTEEKKQEIQDQLRHDIISYFKKKNSLEDTLDEVLGHLAKFRNYNTAEIWLLGHDGKYQNLIAKYAKDKKGSQFYKGSKEIVRFSNGKGLPGMVWSTRSITVWNDITANESFVRKVAAKEAGLSSAVGIPLYHNEKVCGNAVV